MAELTEHSALVSIANRLGMHVRPVQRFAELARAFKADVEVEIRGRRVPGKSVMKLMSLGGRCGDSMTIAAKGEDARQCTEVLRYLADSSFFVEDNVDVGEQPQRHIDRLASMASCFNSEIRAVQSGRSADAKQPGELEAFGLKPTSRPNFEIHGDDQEQARAVIENLVRNYYYVEEAMAEGSRRVH